MRGIILLSRLFEESSCGARGGSGVGAGGSSGVGARASSGVGARFSAVGTIGTLWWTEAVLGTVCSDFNARAIWINSQLGAVGVFLEESSIGQISFNRAIGQFDNRLLEGASFGDISDYRAIRILSDHDSHIALRFGLRFTDNSRSGVGSRASSSARSSCSTRARGGTGT